MALLEVEGLAAFYRDFQALYNVSMSVDAGQIVAVIGANGAGKSTLLKSIVGLISTERDMIHFDGEAIGGLRPPKLVERGIALVPEGRRLFSSLSVMENLMIGGQLGRKGPWSLERVFKLFPILEERKNQRSMSLSGGQQQMVAIGRALMSNPRLLLCDELSLGLAPIIVKDIFTRLPSIVAEGTSIVIVEQDVMQAVTATSYVYCLQEGRVSLEGVSSSLSRDQLKAAYFGV
ncbi:MAG TPA: ABC transporter ATP-binding protein [Magnetospirillaceae bacterium]|jgi:branched-chain amino acid transport system ATP-binding protein